MIAAMTYSRAIWRVSPLCLLYSEVARTGGTSEDAKGLECGDAENIKDRHGPQHFHSLQLECSRTLCYLVERWKTEAKRAIRLLQCDGGDDIQARYAFEIDLLLRSVYASRMGGL